MYEYMWIELYFMMVDINIVIICMTNIVIMVDNDTGTHVLKTLNTVVKMITHIHYSTVIYC